MKRLILIAMLALACLCLGAWRSSVPSSTGMDFELEFEKQELQDRLREQQYQHQWEMDKLRRDYEWNQKMEMDSLKRNIEWDRQYR